MPSSQNLLSIVEILDIIGRLARPLPTTRVPLEDARDLTLAEPVRADRDHPPFDRSLMDGFAIRTADGAGRLDTLTVIGELAAGQVPSQALAAGQAIRINTGAPIPPGADAVVMIEHTELSPNGRTVLVRQWPTSGENIVQRASNLRAGAVVLESGTRIAPAQIAAAAAAGAPKLSVYRRPRVAVLTTGNELVSAGQRPTGSQIRDCNGPCLRALAQQAGCDVTDLGIAGDDRGMLASKVAEGLAADVLCVSGGVSMGQHDYVPEILEAAGVQIAVRKAAIRPGKPMLFGMGPAGQLAFGLPGNPVSSFVCFLVFVRAALARLQGRPAGMPPTLIAKLETGLPASGARAEFLPASLATVEAGQWAVHPLRWGGSGDVFALALASGLILREPNAPPVSAGSMISVLPLQFA
jgi:molybdopterin molybdotransferase